MWPGRPFYGPGRTCQPLFPEKVPTSIRGVTWAYLHLISHSFPIVLFVTLSFAFMSLFHGLRLARQLRSPRSSPDGT